jgi:hypothetical protein
VPETSPRPTRRALLGVAAAATLLAGCASAVPVEVAPHATDPVCASVVLATPDSLGDGLDRHDTTSQATTAWGDPAHAVVLRCGVEPLGPTTEHCVTVATPGGATVDWVAVADDPEHQDDSAWTFTTYGREPAVEVRVPAEVAQERSTAFIDALGPAVDRTTKTRACL